MYHVTNYRSALAILGLLASPCMATDYPAALNQAEREAEAFAGGTLRLALGGKSAAKPSMRLQLTTIRSYRDRSSALPARTERPAGIELGLSAAKKPVLFLMGTEASTLKTKLGMDGDSTAVWILGGLAAAGAALFIASQVFDNRVETERPGIITGR